MPRAPKLKVYRTPIGFHDAYVAAPSQKAAIAAWGADKDVFQRGQAEVVDDPKLTEEPLASPGNVIKRLRGTAAEQIAALGDAPQSGVSEAPRRANKGAPKPRKPPKPKPRPTRTKLDEAEAALAEVEARHEEERKALAEREAALAHERKALEKKQGQERERLEGRREKAEAAYEEAMRRWRAS